MAIVALGISQIESCLGKYDASFLLTGTSFIWGSPLPGSGGCTNLLSMHSLLSLLSKKEGILTMR
jgi:hypothetical protein